MTDKQAVHPQTAQAYSDEVEMLATAPALVVGACVHEHPNPCALLDDGARIKTAKGTLDTPEARCGHSSGTS
ncbi:hypothetical protein MRX96_030707 [Rhipicephalus microplus]